jgi:hypothetical protein
MPDLLIGSYRGGGFRADETSSQRKEPVHQARLPPKVGCGGTSSEAERSRRRETSPAASREASPASRFATDLHRRGLPEASV